MEEQIDDVIELDSFTIVQKTKSTVYEPTDDEFFALANLGIQKHTSEHFQKGSSSAVAIPGEPGMTKPNIKGLPNDEMASMDDSTCQNTDDMASI